MQYYDIKLKKWLKQKLLHLLSYLKTMYFF